MYDYIQLHLSHQQTRPAVHVPPAGPENPDIIKGLYYQIIDNGISALCLIIKGKWHFIDNGISALCLIIKGK